MKISLRYLFISAALLFVLGCGGAAENAVAPPPEAPQDQEAMRKHYMEGTKP